MDTSETYIKMCEKAVEIQKLLPLHTTGEWQSIGEITDKDFMHCDGHGKVIWLTRQDQLQEMSCQDNLTDLFEAFLNFYSEYKETELCGETSGHWQMFGYGKRFTSMEQLWLAFVMEEKFLKQWNGEDWVKGECI